MISILVVIPVVCGMRLVISLIGMLPQSVVGQIVGSGGAGVIRSEIPWGK